MAAINANFIWGEEVSDAVERTYSLVLIVSAVAARAGAFDS